MKARRIQTLAATALVAAASLAGPWASSASAAPAPLHLYYFIAKSDGTGTTLAAAEAAARLDMEGSYGGCVIPYDLIGDGQYTDGTWWAQYATECTSYT